MFYPASAYTSLGSGLIMILTTSYSVKRICQGSKSQFAYILLTFTILYGTQDLANFFIFVFAKPIYVGGETLHSVNMFAH